MYNKKKTIIVIMLVIIMLMATGYAVFSTSLNITTTGNISTTWNIYFSNITQGTAVGGATNATTPSINGTTATMKANLNLPGDSMTYQLTLTNGGNIDAIIESIDAKATGSPAIVFSIDGIKIGDKLPGTESEGDNFKVITIKIEYDNNVTSQPEETDKTLTVTINTVQDTGQEITPTDPEIDQPLLPTKLSTAILRDNVEYADNVRSPYVDSDTGIDFNQNSSDTNGKGLYYTSDTTRTEDGKVVYYFRGDIDNNNVKFGMYPAGTTVNGITYDKDTPIYWQIVRINEDGSVRLLYQGASTEGTEAESSIMTSSPYGSQSGLDAAHVGYMYGLEGLTAELSSSICVTYDSSSGKAVNSTSTNSTQTACETAGGVWATTAYEATHANIVNSIVKANIDSWYNLYLKNDYSTYIADAGFCNDRSLSAGTGYGTSTTTKYLPYYRLNNNQSPQYLCANEENDLFTTRTATKGNKALTNPVGLITLDELRYAGLFSSNTSYHLYMNSPYWTMSPFGANGTLRANVYNSKASFFPTASNQYVRPVINVNGDIPIYLEGTGDPGTATNPYVIKTN